jgi:cysteine synthase B
MSTAISLSQRVQATVGNTPLVPLPMEVSPAVRMYAKLEWYNPFGSLKDRAALWMIRAAQRSGRLSRSGSTIIEPTSGNTGIALAGISRLLGYRVQAVVPEKVSGETKAILTHLGAELMETGDDLCPRVGKGTDQSIALAKAIVKGHPSQYYMPNQYENEANFLAHYEGTGPEIWRTTEGKLTHFFAGIGTGGTITGAALHFKETSPRVRVYAVEAEKNHHLQGLRNLEESAMPKVLERHAEVVDEWIRVSDHEAFEGVKELARDQNLLVGPSSGAVYAAAKRVADGLTRGKCVLVFGDDGRKFMSLYAKFKVFEPAEFRRLVVEADYLPPRDLFNQTFFEADALNRA